MFTPEQLIQVQQNENTDTAFCADIIMRVLANRSLNVCLNSTFSCIQSMAQHVPKEGRMFIADTLNNLTMSIMLIEDDKEQVTERMQ